MGIWLQDTGQDQLTAFPELTRLDTVACCPALLGGIECKLFPERSLQITEGALRGTKQHQGLTVPYPRLGAGVWNGALRKGPQAEVPRWS